MARQDGRIEAGQPLNGAISARAWNRALDAADIVMGARLSLAAGPQQYSSAPYTWVYVQNNTGVDVPQFGVMALTLNISNIVDADKKEVQFKAMPVLNGVMPSNDEDRFCIAVEPIANGSIGRAAIDGVVQCKIAVANVSGQQCVATKADSVTMLKSVYHSPSFILGQFLYPISQESGSSSEQARWGFVRLGGWGRKQIHLAYASDAIYHNNAGPIYRFANDTDSYMGIAFNYGVTVEQSSNWKRVVVAEIVSSAVAQYVVLSADQQLFLDLTKNGNGYVTDAVLRWQ